MTMKRLMLVWVMILCLLLLGGMAETETPDTFMDYSTNPGAYEVSEDELLAVAVAENPDWGIVDSGLHWSGQYQNQLACWFEAVMVRIEDCTLQRKTLSVLVNPLKQGEPVPWDVTVWAPITMTEEAADFLLEMYPEDWFTDELGYFLEPGMMPEDILPGCAQFLLEEGETWDVLFAYPQTLAGIVMNASGQKCVRIVQWNGTAYERAVSSRFFETEHRFSINGYESYDDVVTIACGAYDPRFELQDDGRWLFTGIADSDWPLYGVFDGYVTDASFGGCYDSNDVFHYGVPTFELDLTKADILAIPDFIRNVVPLLDSSAFACVRTDHTPMLDSPGGEPVAACFARLTGRILQRENGYVYLQIGKEKTGLTGWFAENDLAFGADIEDVRCGFPAHSKEDCRSGYLRGVLRGTEQLTPEDVLLPVWLVGRLPDGGWLVQVSNDYIFTAPEDAFREIDSARAIWADFEAEYDRFEQEMLEWAEGPDGTWEDDEE